MPVRSGRPNRKERRSGASATARAWTSRAGTSTAWSGSRRGPTRTGRTAREQADLPGDRPVGGGELGGREAVPAAAAGVVARAVRPGQDGAGAQGLHGPFRGPQLCRSVPYVGREVEVRGCSGRVQILDPQTAAVLISYPRHTQERILIDPACYEGPGTAEVLPPKPLGRMARKLQEIAVAAGGAAAGGPVRRAGGGGPMTTKGAARTSRRGRRRCPPRRRRPT